MNTDLIISDPKIMMGKPAIKGTRLTVELILEKLAAGETVDQLLEAHPRLMKEGIQAALAYAAQTTGKAHGRLEQRTLTAMRDEDGFIDWPGLQQVFKVERQVATLRTGKCTYEVAYGITSLPPERANAACLLAWTRHHWGVENGLHYRRDVTLKEDATRMSRSS